MKTWIIIPTYNEIENLESLVIKINKVLKVFDYTICIVDDASPDGTGDLAEKLKKKHPIKILHRKKKQGLGSAYIAGFKFALQNNVDLIFEMDADFSHNPQDLLKMINETENGNHMIIGSRKIKGGKIVGWNWWRKFCSNGAMVFSRLILNFKTKDVTAGFRCYKRNVLESINLDKIKSNGYAFQEEMLYYAEKQGFKVKEIPVTFIDRKKGKSKLNKKDIVEFFITVIKIKLSEFKTFLKYCVGGGTGLIVDFSLLYLLTDLMGTWYLLSATISFIISALVNYLIQYYWTFKSKRKKFLTQLSTFLIIAIFGLVINNTVIYLMVEKLFIHYLLAKIIAAVIVTFWNFVLNYKITFKK